MTKTTKTKWAFWVEDSRSVKLLTRWEGNRPVSEGEAPIYGPTARTLQWGGGVSAEAARALIAHGISAERVSPVMDGDVHRSEQYQVIESDWDDSAVRSHIRRSGYL